MKTDTTKPAGDVADQTLFDDWFDPVETGLRSKLRGFIETMIEEELDTALSRARYGRRRKLTAADNAAAIGLLYKHSSDRIWLVMLHRTRDLLIRQRSSLISAIRAHFAEFGIVVGQGIRNVERLLALLETARDQRLPALAAEMLGILAAQLRYVAEQVKEVEVKLLARHRADETSRRLQSVPGLGPITASAIVATVGDPKRFKSGRQFAAWLGLVPQQRSSGGKERLGGHQQARRWLYPAVAGARCSCDRWMAEAVGYAQNVMNRAAIGAPAYQCCNVMVVLRADLGLVAPSDDVPRHSRARLTAFPRRETASLSEHIGATDQLIANRQSALSQEIFDIPVAESKPEIEPDSVPDDVWRKSVVGIGNGLHGLNC